MSEGDIVDKCFYTAVLSASFETLYYDLMRSLKKYRLPNDELEQNTITPEDLMAYIFHKDEIYAKHLNNENLESYFTPEDVPLSTKLRHVTCAGLLGAGV